MLVDGSPVKLRTKKELALLIYLAVRQGRSCTREFLASFLWDVAGHARARHSLSQAVYGIRAQIPSLRLIVEPETLGLPDGSVDVDLLRMKRAAKAEQFSLVAELYSGAFLEDLSLENASAFLAWQDSLRYEAGQIARTAYSRCMSALEREGRWTELESAADRLLGLDPVDERAHVARLRAIAASGEPGRARREYEATCTTLIRDWGQSPGPQLLSLSEELGRAAPSACDEAYLDEEQALACAPFVGRGPEFAALRAEWERAKAGEGRLVKVAGAAGIGKTRLCERILRLGVMQGARILDGRCYPSEMQVPYSGIVDALSAGLRPSDLEGVSPVWVAAVAQLLPELAGEADLPSLPALDGEGACRRLLESVARLVQSAASTEPLILFLDDFHWADESTAALVHYLARRCSRSRLLILLACRPDLSAPTRSQHSHRDNTRGLEIRLAEFDQPTVNQLVSLVAARAGAAVSESLLTEIFAKTGGQPFFLVELLRSLVGCAAGPNHQWIANPSSTPLPNSIEVFIRQRLGTLTEAEFLLLSTLSTVGRDATPEQLIAIMKPDREQLATTFERLALIGLVKEDGGRVRFSHDLVREVVYSCMTGLRRRLLHRAVANSLSENGATSAATLATHYDLAGDQHLAFAQAIRAAQESEAVYAHRETEHFLRVALTNAASPAEQVQVKLKLAQLHARLCQFSAAEQIYASLEKEIPAEQNHVQESVRIRVRRAAMYVARLALGTEDLLQQVSALCGEAEQCGDWEGLTLLLRSKGNLAHDLGKRDAVLSVAMELNDLACRIPESAVALDALRSAGSYLSFYQSAEAGRAICEDALRRARRFGGAEAIVSSLKALGTAYYLAGQLGESVETFGEALRRVEMMGAVLDRPGLLNNRAVGLLELGRYPEATAAFREIIAMSDVMELPTDVRLAHCNSAVIAFEMSDLGTARRHSLCILRDNEAPPWWAAVASHGMLGLCAVEEGLLNEAHRSREEVRRLLDERGHWATDFSYAEIFLARLAEREGDTDAAVERLGRTIDGRRGSDIISRSRLELERARLIMKRSPAEAFALAVEVHERAKSMGAAPLVDKAESILLRLQNRGFSPAGVPPRH